MERNKSSFYNAIISMIGMFLTMGVNLIVVRLTISNYGSDANGITSTVTQVISMITLVEAGMTLAINTYLYRPFADNDKTRIEEILSATNNVFHLIGIIFLAIGLAFSFVYPRFIKSELPLPIIISIFVMNIIPQAFNYFFITKYRLMLQVAQKEYIINLITYGSNMISYIASILVIIAKGSLLDLCLITMVVSTIRNALIFIPYKRYFKDLNFKKAKPDYRATRGSGDVMIQRITSTFYSSIPIIFISTFVSASMVSVYAVYASVFGLIKQVSYVFVNSPQHAFGQLYNEKGSEGVLNTFNSYQLMVIMVLTTLLSTGIILISPFIKLYTYGVSDIQYTNNIFIILFTLITWLEIIHIPSGIMINISRKFKLSRDIQIVACVAMILIGFVGGKIWGVFGVLLGKLICNVLLAILEIWYSHRLVLKTSVKYYFNVLLVNSVLCLLIAMVGIMYIPININNYTIFFIAGIFFVFINGIVTFFVNYLIFKIQVKDLINRVMRVLKSIFPNVQYIKK